MYKFGTKAETLSFLIEQQGKINAKILPLCYFTAGDFRANQESIWREVKEKIVGGGLIVRSSAKNEDKAGHSQAGKFESQKCGFTKNEFFVAVNNVLASYDDNDAENQFLVQPVLEGSTMAGVAFTIDPNGGGNYYVINYDDSGSTSSITGGTGKEEKLIYVFKRSRQALGNGIIARLIEVLKRLEKIFDTDKLDVEFAYKDDDIYIFQVRPLFVSLPVADIDEQEQCIGRIRKKIYDNNTRRPFLYGEKTLYSNMTDWNPAEMIGIHPKNLALSLYKELITDTTWAYQRDNYGYMRLRSFPLMVDFCGMPYIDVRISFNSFIPSDLPSEIAEKLVNYYLERLSEKPENHDKVEFDIIFSCYTFDLPKRITILREYGFSDEEINVILSSLKKLTNKIINSKTGLWRQDAAKLPILEQRYREVTDSDLDEVNKIYWLIEDCKRYGTLPFAGLARAGFIAVQLLQSMVKERIIDKDEYEAFMADVTTVGSTLKENLANMSRRAFLRKYGHLRPGTYDITSPRYDENPQLYFDGNGQKFVDTKKGGRFRLTLPQLRTIRQALEQHGLDDDVLGLFTFIKSAIEGRENAKFVFTKNLSEILRLFALWGEQNDFTKENLAFADIQIVREAYETVSNHRKLLNASIESGKRKYRENPSTGYENPRH